MSQNMPFDLDDLRKAQQDVSELTLTNPATGELMNIKIKIASKDSALHRKLSLKIQNEQIKYAEKHRGLASAEKIAENALDLLVGLTMGWEGIAENGKPLEFTKENVRRVYQEFPFIREQVDEFYADRRNFFKE